jgi:hypothetical protein
MPVNWYMEPSWYIDHVGYEVTYTRDERVMGIYHDKFEIYMHFNGFMTLTVF